MAANYVEGEVPPWADWVCPLFVDEVVPVGDLSSVRSQLRLRVKLRSKGQVTATYILSYFGESAKSRWKKRIWLRLLGVSGKIYSRALDVACDTEVSAQMRIPWLIAHLPGTPMRALTRSELPRLTVGPLERLWAQNLRHSQDLEAGGGPMIVISAGATHRHKCWPEERFIAVAAKLIKERAARVILVGGKTDSALVGRIEVALQARSVINLCGQTSLNELLALMSEADLFIGNDGGSVHVAAAAGLAGVVVMSGVHRQGVWDPTAPNFVAVRASDVPCVGCASEFSCPNGHSECVLNITVDSVVAACISVLERISK